MELDKAALIRAAANTRKNKSGSRVNKETRLSIVTDFLNGDESFTTVESVYTTLNPKKSLSSIVQAFLSVIRENELDELCYAVEMDSHVYLTKLVDDSDEN